MDVSVKAKMRVNKKNIFELVDVVLQALRLCSTLLVVVVVVSHIQRIGFANPEKNTIPGGRSRSCKLDGHTTYIQHTISGRGNRQAHKKMSLVKPEKARHPLLLELP